MEEYAKSDSFIKEKYYQDYDIYELMEANEENNYLVQNTQTKGNLIQ